MSFALLPARHHLLSIVECLAHHLVLHLVNAGAHLKSLDHRVLVLCLEMFRLILDVPGC